MFALSIMMIANSQLFNKTKQRKRATWDWHLLSWVWLHLICESSCKVHALTTTMLRQILYSGLFGMVLIFMFCMGALHTKIKHAKICRLHYVLYAHARTYENKSSCIMLLQKRWSTHTWSCPSTAAFWLNGSCPKLMDCHGYCSDYTAEACCPARLLYGAWLSQSRGWGYCCIMSDLGNPGVCSPNFTL